MLTDDGKHLYVSWDEYHMLIERLALKVHASGWEFDQILCLARGGMRPGDVLSRVFDKPLAIMSTSSYRAEAGTIQGRLDMAKYITMPKGELAGRVLLVDDLADTGVTLRAVVDRLRGMPAISELRAAVIWVKGVSSYTPDYYVETLPTSPWIHQPFEEYDNLRPKAWPRSSPSEPDALRRSQSHPQAREPAQSPCRTGPCAVSAAIAKTKKPDFVERAGLFNCWCPGEDSNLHAVKR
jgi:hypoxanthine phosphoribosyltransferase